MRLYYVKGVQKKLEDSFLKQNDLSIGQNSKVMVVLNRFCHADFRIIIGWTVMYAQST